MFMTFQPRETFPMTKARARAVVVQTFVAAVFSLFMTSRVHAQLASADPESLGLDPERLRTIDAAIDRAIDHDEIPGVVVVVGRKGKIAYARAAGFRALKPTPEPMTRDTVFDMASLTKPIATATSVMILLEEAGIRLGDPLVRHLPEFGNHGKRSITIEELLRHRAGLVPDNPIGDFANGREKAWEQMAQIDLEAPPGARFRYSDVGFMILGRLVERQSGMTLDQFAKQRIFDVAGMTSAHFRPAGKSVDVPVGRIAPTEPDAKGVMLRGLVHDPRARALGGVAGHAGLFASADDVAIFAATILANGQAPNGRRLLAPLTVRLMTSAGETPEGERRGLGWDVETSYSSPRGALFGPTSFGHTGFTGTSLWIDPETEMFVVILASRLHPDGKGGSPTALRAKIATLAAAALVVETPRPAVTSAPPAVAHRPRSRPAPPAVLCGVDVLEQEGFKPLQGLRVGLITNHTGLTRDGRSTIDVLRKAQGVTLVRLFSPEHGIRGAVDARVPSSVDQATGLPIVSLYDQARKPSQSDLDGLDALVYDIQDIGSRFYTYITTLGLALEAAAGSGKKFVVLDRPNPIGGLEVSGPVRDPDQESFIAYHRVPVRHGMTAGELARLYNVERKIGANLEVVRVQGWTREMLYDATGLVWVNPSPNIRNLTEALLYPGVGMLEATNLATGRGTDTPFERVGAPWIDPRALARALDAAAIPGVHFTPIHFTPRERQYQGERCGGVFIAVTERTALDPIRLGLELAHALHALYPNDWKPSGLMRLIACQQACDDITAGKPTEAVMARYSQALADFLPIRRRYLLY